MLVVGGVIFINYAMAGAEAHSPLWIVLLPSSPSDISLKTLRAVYGPPLTQALRKASNTSRAFSTVTLLDIAIARPNLPNDPHIPRTFQYANLQTLLGQMYKLICIICTEESIDVQYENDVDARILLLDINAENRVGQVEVPGDTYLFEGPILSLQALAQCQRQWQRLCVIDSEGGNVLLGVFQRLQKSPLGDMRRSIAIERLQSGSDVEVSDQSWPQSICTPQTSSKRHYSVAVGGTFDHLHAGHKLLLTMTTLVLEPATRSGIPQNRTLTIGITGDELLKKKQFAEVLQSWDQRQACVRQFLLALLQLNSQAQVVTSTKDLSDSNTLGKAVQDELKSGLTIKYVELFDAFGPTITDQKISALVVSGETRAGGKAVNDKRKDKGWSDLEVFEVDVLDAEEKDDVKSNDEDAFLNQISSTEIRRRLHYLHSAATTYRDD